MADPIRKNLRWTLITNSKQGNLWIEVKRREKDVFVHIATPNINMIAQVNKLEHMLPIQIDDHNRVSERLNCTRVGYSIKGYEQTISHYALVSHMVNLLAIKYYQLQA